MLWITLRALKRPGRARTVDHGLALVELVVPHLVLVMNVPKLLPEPAGVKIAQGWPKSWAKLRNLIGLSQKAAWGQVAQWANSVKITLGSWLKANTRPWQLRCMSTM